jgi:hypothetical protein
VTRRSVPMSDPPKSVAGRESGEREKSRSLAKIDRSGLAGTSPSSQTDSIGRVGGPKQSAF